MRRILALALIAGVVLAAVEAAAHAELVEAVPRVGSVVPPPVHEIRLKFSEAIEPAFSAIELVAASGERIAGRAAASGDRSELVLRLARALPPGGYRVNWRVVSIDTHRTQGSFTFEVRP